MEEFWTSLRRKRVLRLNHLEIMSGLAAMADGVRGATTAYMTPSQPPQRVSAMPPALMTPPLHPKQRAGALKVMSVMAPPQPQQRSPASTGTVKHAMTMAEKDLAKASNKEKLSPRENVWVNVDILVTHDVCGPRTIRIFKKEFGANAKLTILNLWSKT